jgi:hypothetical protein
VKTKALGLYGSIFAALIVSAIAHADDDKLRDLGAAAKKGETVKWDGADWQLAHDNDGVKNITAGEGLNKTETEAGELTLSVELAGSGSSTSAAKADHSHPSLPPVGAVIAWLKSTANTPALTSGWAECNGQTLDDAESPYNGQVIPNLNGASDQTKRFLRGAENSGAPGGSETHSHTQKSGSNAGKGSTGNNSTDARVGYQTAATSTLPSYYEVVWIIRVK